MITSPTHALAYARICDLLRTAANDRRARSASRRPVRTAAAGTISWLRRGQLGSATPCTDC